MNALVVVVVVVKLCKCVGSKTMTTDTFGAAYCSNIKVSDMH